MSDITIAAVIVVFAATVIITAIVFRRRGITEVPVDLTRLRALQAEWRGPEELLFRSTPRNVRYTGSGRATLAVVGVVGATVLVLAAFLVPAVLRDQKNLGLLGRQGISASGTITRQWTSRDKSETHYHVAYTYAVDGREYASKAEVSKSSNDRLGTGGSVGIHYLPSQPEFSRLDGSVDGPPWLKLLIFLPALILVAVPWYFAQRKKLLAWGTPVGAVVTRNAPTKGGRSIRYTFLDPSGGVVTSSEVVKSRNAPAAGDVITVICDPNKPRRAARFPFSMVTLDH